MPVHMTEERTEAVVETVLTNFYKEGDRIMKMGSPGHFRWSEDRDVTDQKQARIGDDATLNYCLEMHYIDYILTNESYPVGWLFKDDDGDYVEMHDETIKMILAYKAKDKVIRNYNGGYTARYIDREGKRSSKTFTTREEAVAWQRDKVETIWGQALRDLNLYRTYFNV